MTNGQPVAPCYGAVVLTCPAMTLLLRGARVATLDASTVAAATVAAATAAPVDV